MSAGRSGDLGALIYIYLPLCDRNGKQLAYGLAEEMLERCVEYGPFDIPEQWGGPKRGEPGGVEAKKGRYACCFSPAGFTLTLDKMLAGAIRPVSATGPA